MGILRALDAKTAHVPSGTRLSPRWLRRWHDVIVLSDYQRAHLARSAEPMIVRRVAEGAGLLMIGGWGSFSGPFGRWQGSMIERLLPVTCRPGDDRLNFPSGALILKTASHPLLDGLALDHPPIICGLNDIQPRAQSRVLLCAQRVRYASGRLTLENRRYPLLAIGPDEVLRTAAFATDVAPHWCGGLVDWGSRRVTLRGTPSSTLEVGDQYARFVTRLIRWLARLEIRP